MTAPYATPRDQWIADQIAIAARQDRARDYIARKRRARNVNRVCTVVCLIGIASIVGQVWL